MENIITTIKSYNKDSLSNKVTHVCILSVTNPSNFTSSSIETNAPSIKAQIYNKFIYECEKGMMIVLNGKNHFFRMKFEKVKEDSDYLITNSIFNSLILSFFVEQIVIKMNLDSKINFDALLLEPCQYKHLKATIANHNIFLK